MISTLQVFFTPNIHLLEPDAVCGSNVCPGGCPEDCFGPLDDGQFHLYRQNLCFQSCDLRLWFLFLFFFLFFRKGHQRHQLGWSYWRDGRTAFLICMPQMKQAFCSKTKLSKCKEGYHLCRFFLCHRDDAMNHKRKILGGC